MAHRGGYAYPRRLRSSPGRELARRRRAVRPFRRLPAMRRRHPAHGPARFRLRIAVNASTRAAMAVVSGLALALAFPKFDVNFTAWVAFVPLLFAIDGESHLHV